MKNILMGLFAVMLTAGAAMAQDEAKEISVATMPPSVVKTVPAAGATDVDPGLKEITATFSKDMLTDRMWSILNTEHRTPVSQSKPALHRSGRFWIHFGIAP